MRLMDLFLQVMVFVQGEVGVLFRLAARRLLIYLPILRIHEPDASLNATVAFTAGCKY